MPVTGQDAARRPSPMIEVEAGEHPSRAWTKKFQDGHELVVCHL